jgi:hypothetical protein
MRRCGSSSEHPGLFAQLERSGPDQERKEPALFMTDIRPTAETRDYNSQFYAVADQTGVLNDRVKAQMGDPSLRATAQTLGIKDAVALARARQDKAFEADFRNNPAFRLGVEAAIYLATAAVRSER